MPRTRVAPQPIARHGRLKRSRPVGTIVGLIAGALAVVLVSGVSVAAIAVTQLTSSVQSDIHLVHANGATAPPGIEAISGGVNLLLVGTDTRTGQGGEFSSRDQLAGSSGAGNNDVTILLHIAQDHRSAMVVSFPRDLLLPVPACPSPKGGTYSALSSAMLNSTLARGGLSCPVLTIEKLTGVTIPYAASISFDGVAAMSNAVGGVTVCTASAIDDPYTGLSLPAGENTIQGATALAFVRSRHGVGDGSDLGRISNQEVFLSALARKIEGEGVLKNPLELYSIAKAAASNMQLSDELSHVDTMVAIALALKNIPLQNIVMLQYPVVSAPSDPNRVAPSQANDAIVNRALVQDQQVQLTGKLGRAAVLSANPTAAPTPTPAPTKSGGASSAAPTSTSTAAPVVVQLPASISGQSADQQTCSKANGK